MSYYNSKKIFDILSETEIKPLDSELEIEELLIAVKSMEKKIEFFENLKKKRASNINLEIDKIQSRIDTLKSIISMTMENTKNKSLVFPDTAKIALMERKGKWVIDDENELLDMLSKEIDEKEYKSLFQTKISYSKKDIDSYLDKWESGGKVPSCVHRELATKPLKITFTGDSVVSFDEDEMEIGVENAKKEDVNFEAKSGNLNVEDFDGIDI